MRWQFQNLLTVSWYIYIHQDPFSNLFPGILSFLWEIGCIHVLWDSLLLQPRQALWLLLSWVFFWDNQISWHLWSWMPVSAAALFSSQSLVYWSCLPYWLRDKMIKWWIDKDISKWSIFSSLYLQRHSIICKNNIRIFFFEFLLFSDGLFAEVRNNDMRNIKFLAPVDLRGHFGVSYQCIPYSSH